MVESGRPGDQRVPNVAPLLRPTWKTIPQPDFRDRYRRLGSLRELANFWGIPPSQLGYHAFRSDKEYAYKTFSIPRRYGGERKIEAPGRTLKYLQRLVHESLTRVYGPHPAVHGFRSGRSVVTNAVSHLGQRFVLNIDLEEFFPSITRKRVYGRLVAEPYSFTPAVANAIAALCTNAYSQLPQGSPSSPVIANIVAAGLDADLGYMCGSLRCWYTRYADDITISTSRKELSPEVARYPAARGTGQVIVGDRLAEAIESNGFKINYRKSRLQSHWTRQICTGLVVNSYQVSPPRSYIRRLRSLVHHWHKAGWQDAAQALHVGENRPLLQSRQQLKDHVLGRISYLRMVRGQGDRISRRLADIVAQIPPDH